MENRRIHVVFTGLIEATAKVLSASPSALSVERPKGFLDVRIGSSVCVSGACLTVVSLEDEKLTFDLTEETVHLTTFGRLRPGSIVNLERAVKAGDRLGGHIVQGHVEGVGMCRTTDNGQGTVEIELPMELLSSVIPKGSIAIDGVSLTVMRIEGNRVTIALIPHTIANTALGKLTAGDFVNVETDLSARPSQIQKRRVLCSLSSLLYRAPRIGIVYADYYKGEIVPLLESARRALLEAGIAEGQISLHPVAGSFEIPLVGMHLARSGEVSALIALGIIVEGETHHADLLAREVARGIMDVQLETGIPFAFEVLHVRSLAQVRKRHHRGTEAARSTLRSLAELHRIAFPE